MLRLIYILVGSTSVKWLKWLAADRASLEELVGEVRIWKILTRIPFGFHGGLPTVIVGSKTNPCLDDCIDLRRDNLCRCQAVELFALERFPGRTRSTERVSCHRIDAYHFSQTKLENDILKAYTRTGVCSSQNIPEKKSGELSLLQVFFHSTTDLECPCWMLRGITLGSSSNHRDMGGSIQAA